jgi:HipA-like protein
MSLGVLWDGTEVGRLTRVDERSREFALSYSDRRRPISLSLPVERDRFSPAESRPFFEALLPEGAVRDRIAEELRLAASDSFGLLAELVEQLPRRPLGVRPEDGRMRLSLAGVQHKAVLVRDARGRSASP